MGMHYNSCTYNLGGGRKKKIFQIPIPHTYIPNNDSLHKGLHPWIKIYNITLNVDVPCFVYINHHWSIDFWFGYYAYFSQCLKSD